MSQDKKSSGSQHKPAKSGGIPTGGLIAVAVAAALAVLVYNFYTPSPAPSTNTQTSSSGATTTSTDSGSSTTTTSGTDTSVSGSSSTTTATDTSSGGTASSSSTTTSTETAATPSTPPTPDVALEELMKPGALEDIVLGDANAPVTIVEYASMTCPHCANFHTSVLPLVKTKYIDTGKAKLIFREFPLDNLAMGVSMLARCGGPVKFHAFISSMFKTQLDWAAGEGSPLPKLKEITKQAGFTDESFDKCLADQKLQEDIGAIRDRADKNFGITATPTIFINGVKLKEGFGLEEFDKIMKALGHG